MSRRRGRQTPTHSITDVVRSEIEGASKAKNMPDINVRDTHLPKDLTTDHDMIYARALFKIGHEIETDDALDYVVAYINLLLTFFPTQKSLILNALGANGFDVQICMTIDQFAEDRADVDLTDMSEYEDVNMQVMLSSLGIYLLLIRKRLTNLNSTQWIKSRIRTFSQSMGISEEDGAIEKYCPNESFAISTYMFIAPKFALRKILFETINSGISAGGIVGKLMATCLTLLSGTELGNFILCHKYIIIENPILLCWQELAKYAPYLISAIEKFNSMGDKAMFCKFLFPQDQLQELSRDRLRIFASIAREIAILEGNPSLENYRGTDNSTATRELILRAIDIVKCSGGANTRVTQDMRTALLAPGDNEAILAALSIGAFSQEEDNPSPIGASPFN